MLSYKGVKIMGNKETIGQRVDKVVNKVSENVEKAKSKIATAKEDAADIAHKISNSVKKAVK